MRPFAYALALVLAAVAPPGFALPLEYFSDHFVVIAEDTDDAPLLITMDFNRGTSDVVGRRRVAEFVGQFCYRGDWRDLQSGEYPFPAGHPERLVGNGVCRPRRDEAGAWVLDYDGHRATFRVETDPEVLLHVQRDDPEMTTRQLGMTARLHFDGKTYPATVFREQIRWRGYNRLVGVTPKRMYGHFDWMPLVSRRGDWWLLIQDPAQARVPDDAPDHNWGVYRSPEGVIRPIPADEFRLYPRRSPPPPPRRRRRRRGLRLPRVAGRRLDSGPNRPRNPSRPPSPPAASPAALTGAPVRWDLDLPSLGMRGRVFDAGHMLDRFRSGLYAVRGEMYLPGAGRRTVFGLVDHIERAP